MKNKIQLIQKVALLIGATVGSYSSLSADPFRKGNNPEEKTASLNIVTRVEHILVPTDFLKEWQLDNEDKEVSYEIAQTWLKEGKGTLDHSTLHTHINHQRNYNYVGTHFIYPTRYVDQGKDSWPVPKDFETQHLGYRTTIEAIFDPETKLIESKSSHGYAEFISNDYNHELVKKTHTEGDVFSPKLHKEQVKSNIKLKDGHMTFIGSSVYKKQSRLVFQKSESIPILASGKKFNENNITVGFFVAVIDTQKWSNWANDKTNSALQQSSWDWVSQEDEKGKTLDMMKTASTKLTYGQDGELSFNNKTESHAVTYTLPTKDNQNIPANTIASALVPKDFQDFKTGLTIEVAVGARPKEHSAEIKVDFSYINKHGKNEYHRVKDKTKWVSDLSMPIFSHMTQSHGLIFTPEMLTPTAPALIAVSAFVNEDGSQDPSKRTLYFIRAL